MTSERHSLPSYSVHIIVNAVHSQMGNEGTNMAQRRQDGTDGAGSDQLWFIPPAGQETQRRVLTRERVVAEALAAIAQHGVDALSMRALATRLDVVPAA